MGPKVLFAWCIWTWKQLRNKYTKLWLWGKLWHMVQGLSLMCSPTPALKCRLSWGLYSAAFSEACHLGFSLGTLVSLLSSGTGFRQQNKLKNKCDLNSAKVSSKLFLYTMVVNCAMHDFHIALLPCELTCWRQLKACWVGCHKIWNSTFQCHY